MRSEQVFNHNGKSVGLGLPGLGLNLSRKAVIAIILSVALLAFETFNFDTTQYALRSLLGDVQFVGLQWASILAIAFCAIDFAGLAKLFTPERGADEPKEVWYLMGAWLLGATMNAIMTWWAVSLTLLNHNFGNEVLDRETLLNVVPVFVAVLVWLTRILFIGAFTVAGEHIFDFSRKGIPSLGDFAALSKPKTTTPIQRREPIRRIPRTPAPAIVHAKEKPTERNSNNERPTPVLQRSVPKRNNSRIKQRPPMPNGGVRRVPVSGVQARSRNRH